MSIFNVLSLFGGLAMFLYGMRLMGDSLKESSSGALKIAMEHVTNNPVKALLLGTLVTALIQSSTATIVITSGLVGAGIVTFTQAVPIVIGANVGTTVTGQIIRLLDLDSSAGGILEFLKPSTLAPIALIIGIVLLMGGKNIRNSRTIGNIMIGFGVLFTGLLNMTNAVNVLGETGIFENLFSRLGDNPFLGYTIGAGVAFVLQSSSATIGILQAFSSSGQLAFNEVYAVIVGVYLGDCVTTAIVCSIGAKPEVKRVGIMNIIYNLSKTALVLISVAVLKLTGVLNPIWEATVNPGFIANANTIFNLGCAIALLPFSNAYIAMSRRIVKDEPSVPGKYADLLEGLNPAFFSTPALALRSCYDVLMTMFYASRDNMIKSFTLIEHFNEGKYQEVLAEEQNIDLLADRVSNYLAQLSGVVKADLHVQILNHYYKIVNEFERLGDQAEQIAIISSKMQSSNVSFSSFAVKELGILEDLIVNTMDETELTFKRRDINAAYRIEPLEEMADQLIDTISENHLVRLSREECSVYAGSDFMDILTIFGRIADICSNVGMATVSRVYPEIGKNMHIFVSQLHSGKNEQFNEQLKKAKMQYGERLEKLICEKETELKQDA
ncbi:MAG: Na/Pi cotransporter family protein [Solobacterium sp.]|nr:Na/Pi cotransporter family protein [Solobacterium sp.]